MKSGEVKSVLKGVCALCLYDMVICPDKFRLNCYYYRHYSFINDILMIFCTVLGKKMKYAGEEI